MIRPLLLPLAAVAALVPAATAVAATPGVRTYTLTIAGEQSTEWSYEGRSPGSCQAPEDGRGLQRFAFSSAPVRVQASAVGARWMLTASLLRLRATGARSGEHVVRYGAVPDCGQPDRADSQAACGRASWTIPANLSLGLQRPYDRLQLSSGAGQAAGGRPFGDCPFLAGPSSQTYLDQLGRGTTPGSNDAASGLRFSLRRLPARQLARGRAFTLTHTAAKPYAYRGPFGRLTATTKLRWTIGFRPVR